MYRTTVGPAYYESWNNFNELQIAFKCNFVPEDASFDCASPYKLDTKMLRREIVEGGLCSKYAYFKISDTTSEGLGALAD